MVTAGFRLRNLGAKSCKCIFTVGLVVYSRAERQCGFVPFYHIFCTMFVHVYSSHASPGGHEY